MIAEHQHQHEHEHHPMPSFEYVIFVRAGGPIFLCAIVLKQVCSREVTIRADCSTHGEGSTPATKVRSKKRKPYLGMSLYFKYTPGIVLPLHASINRGSTTAQSPSTCLFVFPPLRLHLFICIWKIAGDGDYGVS